MNEATNPEATTSDPTPPQPRSRAIPARESESAPKPASDRRPARHRRSNGGSERRRRTGRRSPARRRRRGSRGGRNRRKPSTTGAKHDRRDRNRRSQRNHDRGPRRSRLERRGRRSRADRRRRRRRRRKRTRPSSTGAAGEAEDRRHAPRATGAASVRRAEGGTAKPAGHAAVAAAVEGEDEAARPRERRPPPPAPRASRPDEVVHADLGVGDAVDLEDLDEETLARRRGRTRKGRPAGRYLMCVHVRPDGHTHIALLEGRSLIEHEVAAEVDSDTSIDGNIYLGRVQNVLAGNGSRVRRHRHTEERRAVPRRRGVRPRRGRREAAEDRAAAQERSVDRRAGDEEPDRRQGCAADARSEPRRSIRRHGAEPARHVRNLEAASRR